MNPALFTIVYQLQPQPCQKNTLVHFFFITTTALVIFFSNFLKERVCLLVRHMRVQVYLIWLMTGMTVNTQRTCSHKLLSHGKVHCVPEVFLLSYKVSGKHVFVKLGIGA